MPKLLLLFTCVAEDRTFQLALVRFYVQQDVDGDLLASFGCVRLVWEKPPWNTTAQRICGANGPHLWIVEVGSIARPVMVVPDFSSMPAGGTFEQATAFYVSAFKWWRPPKDMRLLSDPANLGDKYDDGVLRT